MVNNLKSKTIYSKARVIKSLSGFVCVILLLLLLPLINAQAKRQTIENNIGLTIEFPQVTIFKQNTTQKFHYHVFNSTDGVFMTNTTTTCYLHLYDARNNHIVKTNILGFDKSTNYDFEITLNGNNFSQVGYYSIITQCNTSNSGGFIAYDVLVTPTGYQLETAETIAYIFAITFFSIIFLLFVYGSFRISWKSQNMQGTLGFIKQYRVLKIACIMFAYLTALMLSALLMQVSGLIWYYESLNMIFSYFYQMLLAGVFPIGILAIFLSLIVFVHDYLFNKKLKKLFGKGGNPFGEE